MKTKSKKLVVVGTKIASVSDYDSIFQEVESACSVRIHNYKEERILLYHDVGRILGEWEGEGYNITDLIRRIAADDRFQWREMGERSMWFAVAFYKAYPDREKLPEDKNSITKIKALVYPTVKKEDEEEPEPKLIAQRIFDRYGVEVSRRIVRELQKLIDSKTKES